MARGGKREGAGRKPSPDKKQEITNYIETSIIDALGGREETKRMLYLFAKIKAAKAIKQSNNFNP